MKVYKEYSSISVTRRIWKKQFKNIWKNSVVLTISLEWHQASSKFAAYKTSCHPRSADWPAGSCEET